jgi:hypothetical protein
MLSLKQKIGLLVAGTTLPTVSVIWMIAGDAPSKMPMLATGQTERKAASLSLPTAIDPRLILPNPLRPPVVSQDDARAQAGQPTVEDKAVDALEDIEFGKTPEELAASSQSLDRWSRGVNSPFGELPLFLDFSGVGGGLAGASTTISPDTAEKLRRRWGPGERINPHRTLYYPKPGMRADLFAPDANAPGRPELGVRPVMPSQDIVAPGRSGLGLSAIPLLGQNIDDLAQKLKLEEVQSDVAYLFLPATEFSDDRTLVTLHHRDRVVIHITVDLVEEVKPGLADRFRDLLTQKFGPATSEVTPDGLLIETYVHAEPPVQTVEYGGGERVQLEIGGPLPPRMPSSSILASGLASAGLQ